MGTSKFKRINNWLHLWLGLTSGIIVFIVCITAAIWVWRDELRYLTQPYDRMEAGSKPFLPPSILLQKARQYDSLKFIYSIQYRKAGKTTTIGYADKPDGEYKTLYVSPYDGHLFYKEEKEPRLEAFLTFVRAGHRFLWLPQKIGSPIVGAGCIVFLILLITGLIWWYPNKWSKANIKKSFRIKWDANWKRVNLDLHNVYGFYAFLVAIILTVTGVAFTFSWFDRGLHWVMTGGSAEIKEPEHGKSDTTAVYSLSSIPADHIWDIYHEKFEQGMARFMIVFPDEKDEPYLAVLRPTERLNYGTLWYSHDQYTLKKLGQSLDVQNFSLGEKIYTLNFETHTGVVGGITTKMLAFLASLVGASLPVTGTLIWYNRRYGKKKAIVK